MTDRPDYPTLGAAALRRLDEDLTRSVPLPPIEAVLRRAESMNRTTTAATAAVLTVGALGAVTVVAQSVVSGAAPLPAPVALSPALYAARPAPAAPPPVAQVLNPGERLVRLKPGVPVPAGARTLAGGVTVLSPGATVDPADAEPVVLDKRRDRADRADQDGWYHRRDEDRDERYRWWQRGDDRDGDHDHRPDTRGGDKQGGDAHDGDKQGGDAHDGDKQGGDPHDRDKQGGDTHDGGDRPARTNPALAPDGTSPADTAAGAALPGSVSGPPSLVVPAPGALAPAVGGPPPPTKRPTGQPVQRSAPADGLAGPDATPPATKKVRPSRPDTLDSGSNARTGRETGSSGGGRSGSAESRSSNRADAGGEDDKASAGGEHARSNRGHAQAGGDDGDRGAGRHRGSDTLGLAPATGAPSGGSVIPVIAPVPDAPRPAAPTGTASGLPLDPGTAAPPGAR